MNEYDYIINAFTQDGERTNLDITHLDVGCISSRNDKFNLDCEGNLTVKSITTESGASLDFNAIYPVGSIYLSTATTSPSVLFGGTWEQIKDKFLLACGDTYQNATTGGEATHVLTTSEMPSHTHTIASSGEHNHTAYFKEHRIPTANYSGTNDYARKSSASYDSSGQLTVSTGPHTHVPATTGGNAAHNNMPPYLAVYVWKRTA